MPEGNSNWAALTLAWIATDAAIPEPTDAAWPKWAGYAVAGTIATGYLGYQNFKNNPFYYVTYIKTNLKTKEVYVGRSSGYGTPQSVVRQRDSNHHITGYGPAVLSSYAPATIAGGYASRGLDPSYWFIRGSEQVQIETYRLLGVSGNRYNGVSPTNKNIKNYINEASKYFK